MTRPWEILETAQTPDGPLALRRRGEADFTIAIRGRVLMTSTAHRSEDALARLGCGGLGAHARARVLIGGLGMGFTLRAALDVLGPDAQVTVAELNPVVAAWCQGPLAALTARAASDPRVQVEITDVAKVIARAGRSPASRFHAIVLDLYEGPQARVPPGDPLYGPRATAQVVQALRAGGTYAVWCEQPSAGFERNLRGAGFTFDTTRSGRGGRVHLIYTARVA